MRRVLLESPFAGDVEGNLEYVRLAMRDCLMKGDAPFASHALYTQKNVLDDLIPEQRALGIATGYDWGEVAEASVFYVDRGISDGMIQGHANATLVGRPIEFRSLGRGFGCQCVGPTLLLKTEWRLGLPFCPTCRKFCGVDL